MEILIAAIFILGISTSVIIHKRRTSKDYREHIEPVLHSHGLNFISSEYPGMFKVGPFPKFEVTMGRPQSRAGGISGEYSQYRVIRCSDSDGHTYELWAMINFEVFIFHSIRWRLEKGQKVPTTMESTIES